MENIIIKLAKSLGFPVNEDTRILRARSSGISVPILKEDPPEIFGYPVFEYENIMLENEIKDGMESFWMGYGEETNILAYNIKVDTRQASFSFFSYDEEE